MTPALDVSGPAYVVDGDTIRIGSERIRLEGIDAPELHQQCQDQGRAIACGATAKAWLERLAGGRLIVCRGSSRDRYRRLVAVCRAEGMDLGAYMVGAGWAVAYDRYSRAYDGEQDRARAAGLGLWAIGFEQPADWRRSHR